MWTINLIFIGIILGFAQCLRIYHIKLHPHSTQFGYALISCLLFRPSPSTEVG